MCADLPTTTSETGYKALCQNHKASNPTYQAQEITYSAFSNKYR